MLTGDAGVVSEQEVLLWTLSACKVHFEAPVLVPGRCSWSCDAPVSQQLLGRSRGGSGHALVPCLQLRWVLFCTGGPPHQQGLRERSPLALLQPGLRSGKGRGHCRGGRAGGGSAGGGSAGGGGGSAGGGSAACWPGGASLAPRRVPGPAVPPGPPPRCGAAARGSAAPVPCGPPTPAVRPRGVLGAHQGAAGAEQGSSGHAQIQTLPQTAQDPQEPLLAAPAARAGRAPAAPSPPLPAVQTWGWEGSCSRSSAMHGPAVGLGIWCPGSDPCPSARAAGVL